MSRIRIGREVPKKILVQQVGLPTILAISGGRFGAITDDRGYEIGLTMPCGTNREVEIVLNGLDLYDVRRYRRIVKGAKRGEDVLEFEETNVFFDQLPEIAWQASLWR